jgi:two-component system chemotaxis sensor kinase CheA
VRLTAEHAEGQIVVTVTDDGGGIDPEQIRQAAVRRGMLSEEEAARLSDDEAITQIFRPGLSTAEEVTDVSGRGVGLDIVRTNIGRIGGSVTVESEVGWGTTFRVMLPLTLATVQTMLVNLGEDVYAIPLVSIIESLYLTDIKVSSIKGNPAIQWRGNVLPLLDLSRFFGRGSAAPLLSNMLARDCQIPASCDEIGALDGDLTVPLERVAGGGFASSRTQEKSKTAIVVVTWGKLQVGLVVNRILGKQEIVAKPLGSIIGNAPGLSGCTILGDGRIALIVDVPSLINATMQARTQTTREESS